MIVGVRVVAAGSTGANGGEAVGGAV